MVSSSQKVLTGNTVDNGTNRQLRVFQAAAVVNHKPGIV